MRLAVCTLSAVLLSGCSWFGYGGGSNGYGGGAAYGAGAGCGNSAQYAYANQYGQAGYAGGAYGASGCGAGYGSGAGGYGVAGYGANGYGANGYGQGGGYGGSYGSGANGYGVGTGALGLRGGVQGAGAYGYGAGAGGFGAGTGGYGVGGATGYGAGGYGAGAGGQFVNGQWVAGTTGAGTVLGGVAPYGTAAGGQFINGQWVTGASTSVAGGYGVTSGVTTVQGAPIYVPQPYPAYYGVGYAAGGGYAYGGGLRGSFAAALPFGIEAGIGTDIAIGGDIVGAKPAGPALACCGGVGNLDVSATPAISYGDAYKNAVSYDLAATFDIDPSTTLVGRIGYSDAEGQRLRIGTIDDRQINPGSITTEDLYAEWSDLEQITLEGGVRKYMGGWNNSMSGVRPYVGAMAGFTHNNAVTLTQESATLMPVGANVQQYIDAGWTPTASGVVGAEMQVGPRTAIGVEAGIRWRDDLNTNTPSEDRWSVPIKLRGRVSF